MTLHLTAAQTDRACGALIGSAAGDALGAGYEFAHLPEGLVPTMIGGGLGNFAPGEWTDDTSMSWAIAGVAATGVDLRTPEGLDAIAAHFREWYDTRPPDIGINTATVLRAAGAAPTGAVMTAAAQAEHDATGHTGGNGSLMRTAAVGLTHLDDPTALVEAAMAVSALTHADPRAQEACALWSLAVRHAVIEGEYDVRAGLERLTQDAAAFWADRLDEAEQSEPATFNPNGYVVTALQAAWSAIVHTPIPTDGEPCGQLVAALENAVRIGDDTDTVAAIAGALAGARWGMSAVPASWRRVLHGYPGLTGRDLERLAFLTARGGRPGKYGWPLVDHIDYRGLQYGKPPLVRHPHDHGVWLSGAVALDEVPDDVDAVVSLCLTGRSQVPSHLEHVNFRIMDEPDPEANPHLDFVVADAAHTVKALRDEGKVVLLHCVAAYSRTPTIGMAYAMLLGVPLAQARGEVCSALPAADPNISFQKALMRLDHRMTKKRIAVTENPHEAAQPKIADIVRANLGAIVGYCVDVAPQELEQLADPDYSKAVLGLNFPFWKLAGEVLPKSAEHSRYWTTPLEVSGQTMRVTSQWHERHIDPFLDYLAARGLATQTGAEATAAAVVEAQTAKAAVAATSKSRYRGKPVGDAQNAFVRTLLSNLGVDSFTNKNWLETVAHFDHRCVYCGAVDELVMDHAIPINRESLGEHRLGNLVPACHTCNSAKGRKDFRDFPGCGEAAIAKIEAFMDSRNYVPLGDDEQVRLFLNTAYAEVGALASRYLTLLNAGSRATD